MTTKKETPKGGKDLKKQGIALLKDIDKKSKEFREIYRQLCDEKKYYDLHQMGSIVIGLYCPEASIDFTSQAGPETQVKGLKEEIKEMNHCQFPSIAGLFGGKGL